MLKCLYIYIYKYPVNRRDSYRTKSDWLAVGPRPHPPGVQVRVISFLCILPEFSSTDSSVYVCFFFLPLPRCGSGEHTKVFGHLALRLGISLKSFHISHCILFFFLIFIVVHLMQV